MKFYNNDAIVKPIKIKYNICEEQVCHLTDEKKDLKECKFCFQTLAGTKECRPY